MEVKSVSDGYAKNFLFPRKLAVPADSDALHIKKSADDDSARKLEKLHDLKKKIETITLEFPIKTSARGGVFGSVTEHDITRSLAAHGIRPVKPVLQKPIRMLGEHAARVELGLGISADVKIILKPSREES